MYEAWEKTDPPRRLGEPGTLDEAIAQIDAECHRRHAQTKPDEVAWLQFEVRGPDGRPVFWHDYSPDPRRPYESPLTDEIGGTP